MSNGNTYCICTCRHCEVKQEACMNLSMFKGQITKPQGTVCFKQTMKMIIVLGFYLMVELIDNYF